MKCSGCPFPASAGTDKHSSVQVYTGSKLYRRLAKRQHDESEIMNFSDFTVLKLVTRRAQFHEPLHGWWAITAWPLFFVTRVREAVLCRSKTGKQVDASHVALGEDAGLKEKIRRPPPMNPEG